MVCGLIELLAQTLDPRSTSSRLGAPAATPRLSTALNPWVVSACGTFPRRYKWSERCLIPRFQVLPPTLTIPRSITASYNCAATEMENNVSTGIRNAPSIGASGVGCTVQRFCQTQDGGSPMCGLITLNRQYSQNLDERARSVAGEVVLGSIRALPFQPVPATLRRQPCRICCMNTMM